MEDKERLRAQQKGNHLINYVTRLVSAHRYLTSKGLMWISSMITVASGVAIFKPVRKN